MVRLLHLQQSVGQHGDFVKVGIRSQNSLSENKEDGMITGFVYSALCVCIQEKRGHGIDKHCEITTQNPKAVWDLRSHIHVDTPKTWW